jgi:hypothetical protein
MPDSWYERFFDGLNGAGAQTSRPVFSSAVVLEIRLIGDCGEQREQLGRFDY